MGRWEVPRFIQEWGGGGGGGGGRDAGCVQNFIFLFLMLIKRTKRRDGFKIFLRNTRDVKTLLRSSANF